MYLNLRFLLLYIFSGLPARLVLCRSSLVAFNNFRLPILTRIFIPFATYHLGLVVCALRRILFALIRALQGAKTIVLKQTTHLQQF